VDTFSFISGVYCLITLLSFGIVEKQMKATIAFLTILVIAGFIFINPFRIQAFDSVSMYAPCAKPLGYKIGTIDPRFELTDDELKSDIAIAGDAWSNAYGKNLFVYDPEASLIINLVYDKRQDLSQQINSLKGEIETDKNAIKPEIDAYEKRVAVFNERMRKLNADIEAWNASDGTSEGEYGRLKKEQDELNSEAAALNVMARSLNQSSDEFSAKVGELNQTVRQFNSALTVKPEEGLYDPNTNTISIYFHTNQQEFIHTLSHELGHALGMGHVENDNAIMNAQTNTQRTPGPEDIAELQRVCRERSYVELAADRFMILYNFYFNRNAAVTN
jgi:predicted nuclease with TOPRIM domain